MKRNSGNQQAFTLIEMMIVVAVIGILASIAMPKFNELIAHSKEGTIRASLGSIRSALSIYYSDTDGSYPTQLAALSVTQKYMKELPTAVIPSFSGGSTGHNLSGETDTFDDGAGGAAWFYSTSGQPGVVRVNCNHLDTRGVVWSSY